MSRLSSYSPEIAEEILTRMSEGEALGDICDGKRIPRRGTVNGWATSNFDGFAAKYTLAREMQGHVAAERAIKRALQRSGDAQADRLEYDALKWYAGKMAPRAFGDKITQEQVGADGGPILHTYKFLDPTPEFPAIESPGTE